MRPGRHALAPDYTIARTINGGWQLAAGHREVADRRNARQVVDDLLRLVDAGFTTFDCADIYTGVESLLGEVVAARPDEVQVHTKLVPDRGALANLDRTYVERVVDRSRRRLGVERLDLVQLHWWAYDVPGWLEAAGWLDDLRRAGAIRCLGLTNFDAPRVQALVDAGIEITSHQVQYSVLDRRPAEAMTALCRARGISLLTYGTLAGGFLSGRWHGRPAPTSPLANRSLIKYRLIIDECGGWATFQSVLDALDEVARRHDVSIATVATAWVLARPRVAAAIVGTRSADHLDDRLRLAALELDDEDRQRLAAALADVPSPPGPVYGLEREVGGRHAVIMKTDLNRLDG